MAHLHVQATGPMRIELDGPVLGAWRKHEKYRKPRERPRAVARQCGVHHLANLGGCPAG
jgi:hypothetical protein